VFFSDIRLQDSASWRRITLLIAVSLLAATTSLVSAVKSGIEHVYHRHVKKIAYWNDTPAAIASYLKPKLRSGDYIFIVSDFPVVYFLADAKIPTRYAFPPFLIIQEDLPNITGVVPAKELGLILQKKPIYIVTRNSVVDEKHFPNNQRFFEQLVRSLEKAYFVEANIGSYRLYRLKSESCPGHSCQSI
jgi:hypothetical protein